MKKVKRSAEDLAHSFKFLYEQEYTMEGNATSYLKCIDSALVCNDITLSIFGGSFFKRIIFSRSILFHSRVRTQLFEMKAKQVMRLNEIANNN